MPAIARMARSYDVTTIFIGRRATVFFWVRACVSLSLKGEGTESVPAETVAVSRLGWLPLPSGRGSPSAVVSKGADLVREIPPAEYTLAGTPDARRHRREPVIPARRAFLSAGSSFPTTPLEISNA